MAATPDAYLPTPSARHAIEWLVDEAGLALPTTQWPLPAAAVADALAQLPADLTPAQRDARDLIRADLRRAQAGQLSLSAATRSRGAAGFGAELEPGASIALRSSAVPLGERLSLQLGVREDGGQLRLDQSSAVLQLGPVNAQAWSHRSWWSPGWQSSLVLGNNAPALSGLGVQRASAGVSDSPWLAWLGPWNAEFFMAQTENPVAPANPWLVGNRLTMKPFSGLELGFTRTAQWGGQGRDQSISGFVSMLTGTGTNADTLAQQAKDPGNQMAGFDVRVRCPAGVPCAAYTQMIGEDMAGIWPGKYLSLYGLETWTADGRQRYFLEYVHSSCATLPNDKPIDGCAYRNGQYPGGYASAGRWLGAGFGPDAQVLTLGGLDAGSATQMRLHVGVIHGLGRSGAAAGLANVSPFVAGSTVQLRAIEWQRDWPLAGGVLTPQLGWQRLSGQADGGTAAGWVDRRVQAGASWRIALDEAASPAGSPSTPRWGSSDASPWLWGAALMAGGLALDRSADAYARSHGAADSTHALRQAGNAVPVAALGLATADWALGATQAASPTARAAVTAGVASYGASWVLKKAVRRDRPTVGQGPGSFGSPASQGDYGFPSAHAAMAWAVLTPYAQATGSNLPYYLAGLTQVSRVLGRQHWASDTVAGALLGYGLGSVLYQRGVAGEAASATLLLQPNGLAMHWKLP
ncbi:MAG: capsule assembly Wzi family protein [Leptothrix sp. (in: b-proteobacteria)]